MFYAALTPLLPHYADELGLSKAGAGVLAGSYAFGALVAGIPAGMLATRVGVKPTLLVGLGGMTVTTALFGFADSEWLLDTARFLQGAASSCSWTAGLAWLVADAPADARGRLIGSAMGVAIFGAMLGPVIGAIASITSTRGDVRRRRAASGSGSRPGRPRRRRSASRADSRCRCCSAR